jgi:hypothetical protein
MPPEFGNVPVAVAGFRLEFGPSEARYRRPDVVGLPRQPVSDDRQLLNFDDRISNVRVRTKSLISKNDLRF